MSFSISKQWLRVRTFWKIQFWLRLTSSQLLKRTTTSFTFRLTSPRQTTADSCVWTTPSVLLTSDSLQMSVTVERQTSLLKRVTSLAHSPDTSATATVRNHIVLYVFITPKYHVHVCNVLIHIILLLQPVENREVLGRFSTRKVRTPSTTSSSTTAVERRTSSSRTGVAFSTRQLPEAWLGSTNGTATLVWITSTFLKRVRSTLAHRFLLHQ